MTLLCDGKTKQCKAVLGARVSRKPIWVIMELEHERPAEQQMPRLRTEQSDRHQLLCLLLVQQRLQTLRAAGILCTKR